MQLHPRTIDVAKKRAGLAYECVKRLDGHFDYPLIIRCFGNVLVDLSFIDDDSVKSKAMDTKGLEFIEYVKKERGKLGLTPGEFLGCVADMLATHAKYMVRAERHGDEYKRGDEA